MSRFLMMGLLLAGAGCDVTGSAFLAKDGTEQNSSEQRTRQARALADCPASPDAEELADQLQRLINIERFDVGTVEMDAALTRIASDYACRMITDDFFGHDDPVLGGISKRIAAAGYAYEVVGENLAASYWTASEILDAWLASPTHREILLDPTFTNVGIGVRYGGRYGIYCVLIMADPAD